jgi:hypothetical protein
VVKTTVAALLDREPGWIRVCFMCDARVRLAIRALRKCSRAAGGQGGAACDMRVCERASRVLLRGEHLAPPSRYL